MKFLNKHFVRSFSSFQKFQNFKNQKLSKVSLSYFTTSDSKKVGLKEIKEKLEKEGSLKIYDSTYTFSSEKLLIQGSAIFSLIFSSTVLFSNISLWLKIINIIFLAPCVLIQIEYFLDKTRFIKIIKLLPNNKLLLINIWGKNEKVEISDMNKATNDPRVEKQREMLNHQNFIILTNKKNSALYHVPRDGIFLDEELFHTIVEGKTIS